MEWLKKQGPWSPGLIDYLKRHYKQYEALVFYNYLYAPTVLGLQIDPGRSILVPVAHDEPPIHLSIYRDVFRAPKAIGYLSEPERKFATQSFDRNAVIEETIGCGVELPPHHAYPRPAGRAEGDDVPAADAGRWRSRGTAGGQWKVPVSRVVPREPASNAVIAFTARLRCTAGGSIRARDVRSSLNISARTSPPAATRSSC